MSRDNSTMEIERDSFGRPLPPLRDGADPWCEWCDEDLPETVYLLHDHDDGRWPPAFCSVECAESWGCAADEGEAYSLPRSEVVAFDP